MTPTTTSKRKIARWGQGILALLLLAGLAVWPLHPGQAADSTKETYPRLCGRLVFLTEFRTQQKLIGLIPCGRSGNPLVFDARPGVLSNYYRLYDAVVDNGERINTLEYGSVSQYITKFSGFESIPDCNHCKEVAPTRTPNGPQAAQDCAGYLLESGVELFPEFEAAEANQATLDALEEFANSNEVKAQCSGDETCEAEQVALETGRQLGERIKRTPERRDRLIEFLLGVVKNPAATAICKRFPERVRFVAAGLSQKGFAIDALASSSPATHLITDAQDRRTGLLESGAPVEEIPGAGLAITGLNKLVLLPGGVLYETAFRGTAAGPASLEAAINHNDEVWLITFHNTPVSAGMLGRLDLSGELPWLQLSSAGTESASPAAPFVRLPVLESWLATPTPAPPAPPAATQTVPAKLPSPSPSPEGKGSKPAPTQTALALSIKSTDTPRIRPAVTQSESGSGASPPAGSACPFSVVAAMLPVMIAAAIRIQKQIFR